MILTDLFESREIHNQDRLDQVLARCIEMVHEKNQANPKKYGKVAACIIDMKNRKVFGINSPGADGRRRHAERMAIDAYHKRYGKILPGAIIVTTLSPCNRDMAERDGASCQDLLLQVGIEKVYSGYMDPSQHSDHPFTEETTQNDDLWRQCKQFSDSFVHDDLTESQHDTVTADQVLDYVKRAHAPEAFDIEYSITDHPEWELKTIPLSQLNLDPDGEAQDPYNRVNWVDDDKVQELIPRIGSVLKSLPIVVDSEGWIIDGNHRAMAAAEAGLTSVPAYVPVKPVVAENSKQINWIKPNFDYEWDEIEFQADAPQVPSDVRNYMARHFPNKQAWMKAVVHGRPVVVAPDHGQKIRNYPDNKRDLLNALSPQSHDPQGPAKKKRVNALFDKGGPIEMPIILQTEKGLWLIGGKTRLGTANLLKGIPAKVWMIGGKQGMTENFADGRNPQDKGDAKRHGINTKASVSSLRKTAKQGGRKGQLAHWLANMKAGRAKARKK
jgi:pyrimidine deaminase RibD-like protein